MGLEIHEIHDVGAWLAENVPGAAGSAAARRLTALSAAVEDAEADAEDVDSFTPPPAFAEAPIAVPVLPELDGVDVQRSPMRCVRTPGQLVAAARAVLGRELHDQRYVALVRGVRAAEDWVLGFTDTSPVRGELLPRPSLAQIVEEYAHALAVSSGLRAPIEGTVSDLARVVAHGSELYLLWYAFADVATPAVLDPDVRPVEVARCLGDVGFDVAGLHGPQISRLRFAPVSGARFAVVDGALVTVAAIS